MKTFTDNTGRTWTLSVTVGTIKRVRALCGVDLANIITMESGKTPNVERENSERRTAGTSCG